MEPTDDFFSGNRYAIFGVCAPGRLHGKILIRALRKAGKTPIVIEPQGLQMNDVEVYNSLAKAGSVDGVVILPPAPWDQSSAEFTADAVPQCRAQGIEKVWIYTAGDSSPAAVIAREQGLDAVLGKCPCLYIANGGFPHNLHRWIAKLVGQL
ncbi:MAG: CoA-binding protein [Armatimonadetes bacterium]|nr:CoA-binding protein [Armatimonadota bacterium]